MTPHPDAVEGYVVEDYVLESNLIPARRLVFRVARERRVYVVPHESRMFLVRPEER